MTGDDYPKVKNAFLLCLLLIFLQIGTGIIAGLILGYTGYSTESNQYGIAVALIQFLCFGVVILLGFKKTNKRFIEVFKFVEISPVVWLSSILIAIGLVIINSEIDNILNLIFPMPSFLRDVFSNLGVEQNIVISIIILGLIPAFTEEMLFRGLFLSGFSKNYPVIKSVIFSSLLFGLIHLNPWQFVTGFLMGIPLAYIFINTRSIIPSILIHGLNNLLFVFTSRFQSMIPIRGLNNINTEKIVFQPIWFDILGACLLIGGFYVMNEKIKKDNPIRDK